MTDETVAAATEAAPTDIAPAATEQAKPEQSVQPDAAQDAGTKANPDKPDGDNSKDGEDSAEGVKKTVSRSERMRRRMRAMATELDSLRAQLPQVQPTVTAPKAGDQPPQEADFNGDYFAYQSAKTAYDVKQELRSEFERERQHSQKEREAALKREAAEDFFERADEIRAHIPDYDDAIESLAMTGFAFKPHVVEELMDSEHGPLLAYQISKNPQKAAELNAMSQREVAREIGRLEARASLPKPKTTTQAPPPLKTPTGGAAPSSDLATLAKSEDITDFVKAARKS